MPAASEYPDYPVGTNSHCVNIFDASNFLVYYTGDWNGRGGGVRACISASTTKTLELFMDLLSHQGAYPNLRGNDRITPVLLRSLNGYPSPAPMPSLFPFSHPGSPHPSKKHLSPAGVAVSGAL